MIRRFDLSACLAAAERYIKTKHALEAVAPASLWLNIERAALAENATGEGPALDCSRDAATFRYRAGYR